MIVDPGFEVTISMEKGLKTLLVTKRILLLDNLDMTYLVDYLVQEEILNLDQREDIMTEKTRRQKVERFLVLLAKLDTVRGVFDVMCSALNKEGYGFIASELKEAIKEETEDDWAEIIQDIDQGWYLSAK